jgi:hypothetical protein
MKRVLAFDIGIKNLAWCCGDLSGSAAGSASATATAVTVRGWANENLISGGTAEEDAAASCCEVCKKKAAYANLSSNFCVRHCPPSTPALRDLSGNLLKKIPSLAVLKALAATSTQQKFKSKELVLTYLRTKFCFPKVSKAVKGVDLESLHDGIRKMVLANRDLFSTCTEILLENQPVLKNPVMKSVQMMLFATLRDLLGPTPPKVRLVHAGRKTAATPVAAGDEGYSDRKNASEARIVEGLKSAKILMGCTDGRGAEWFGKQAKRSDLADCLSMVMDSA